jgi:hypothetical protein
MNFVKVLGIVLLAVAWLAVLLTVVLPMAALVLGLGIDVPRFLARSGRILLVYSHSWFSLFIGLGVLIALGLAAWHILRG